MCARFLTFPVLAGHFLYPLVESASSEAGEQQREAIAKLHADYQAQAWEADVQAYHAGSYSQVSFFLRV